MVLPRFEEIRKDEMEREPLIIVYRNFDSQTTAIDRRPTCSSEAKADYVVLVLQDEDQRLVTLHPVPTLARKEIGISHGICRIARTHHRMHQNTFQSSAVEAYLF